MTDHVHVEQQAILRALRTFEEGPWRAFQKRGFATLGDGFTAYLLMQLVSAKNTEMSLAKNTVDLTCRLAKPLTPKEELDREVDKEADLGEVVVRG